VERSAGPRRQGGNVCALLADKDHVNLFLYDGVIVPDPEGIITGGHDDKTARTISFRQRDAIPRRALTKILSSRSPRATGQAAGATARSASSSAPQRGSCGVRPWLYMTSMIGKRVSASRHAAAKSAVPTSPLKSE
jgi:hypothetical protein